jgi:hypothetical protein
LQKNLFSPGFCTSRCIENPVTGGVISMNLNEYAAFDGIGLAELVQKGEISPGELS